MSVPTVSAQDRGGLRELARQVAAIGRLPIQEEKAERWRRHNDLQPERPLVLIFPEGAWREMLPWSSLTCQGDWARGVEYDFRVRLYYHEHLPDDNVIEPVIASPIITHDTGWGIEGKSTRPTEATGAYHIDGVIQSEADLDRLQTPQVTVDWPATAAHLAFMQELFGDLLTVEQRGRCSGGAAPVDQYNFLRGLDHLFTDLIDHPAMVHRAIAKLTDAHIAIYRSLEAQGALTLGNRNHYTGSGGTGYTRQLPQPDFDGKHVRTKDQWGMVSAQIFSEVSPKMHAEFALAHEKRFLDLFGLNCYGCCEPLHHKLKEVKTIPRLRRVSISPWAKVAVSAAELQDRYIFSWKPNPAVVAGEGWDAAAVRRGLREFLATTRGCVVEMILKDTHTCRSHPERMWEWVQIAREEAEALGR